MHSKERHEPTHTSRKLVKELYACGVSKARIAERLKISPNTLQKWYEDELDNNKEQLASALAKNLYNDALEGNQRDREFWLRCQARWAYAKSPEELEQKERELSLLEKEIDNLNK